MYGEMDAELWRGNLNVTMGKLWTRDIKFTASEALKENWYVRNKDIANMDSNYKGSCWACKETERTFYHMCRTWNKK